MRGTQAGLLNRSTGNGNSSSLLSSANQWKVNQAGPDSVLKTEGVRKRIEFDSTSLPPILPF